MSDPEGSPTGGQDPEEEITPDDSASQISKTSSACASTTSKAYLKAASRRAKTEAEIAFLKKKVDLELSMVDLEAEERIEEAQRKAEQAEREAERERKKAERARRRRRAEIDLQQVNAFSKLEAIRAQEQAIGEMMHESRSTVSRVRWKGHPPSDNSGQSLTLHNALEHSRYPMSKDRKDQTIAPILLNVPTKTTVSSRMQQLDQMVSPLITTTATMHPSFFDDRDHLFTAIAPTSDVNHLASTSLQNRVTETPFSVPYTHFTRHSHPPPCYRRLCAP